MAFGGQSPKELCGRPWVDQYTPEAWLGRGGLQVPGRYERRCIWVLQNALISFAIGKYRQFTRLCVNLNVGVRQSVLRPWDLGIKAPAEHDALTTPPSLLAPHAYPHHDLSYDSR